jgi:hypothetical protein
MNSHARSALAGIGVFHPRVRNISGALVALVVVLGPLSAGATTTVFGPTLYTQTGSAPVHSCLPNRAAKVRTENGPQGRPKATRATVRLNGQTVISFTSSGGNPIREQAVTLNADNTIAVTTLSGPAGATLGVSVLSDVPCVNVTIASPAPGTQVPQGPLVVRGTVPAIAGSA